MPETLLLDFRNSHIFLWSLTKNFMISLGILFSLFKIRLMKVDYLYELLVNFQNSSKQEIEASNSGVI